VLRSIGAANRFKLSGFLGVIYLASIFGLECRGREVAQATHTGGRFRPARKSVSFLAGRKPPLQFWRFSKPAFRATAE
jgi:hypothetical protein